MYVRYLHWTDHVIYYAVYTPETRPFGKEVTGKYSVKNCDEASTEWNCDTNGGDNLCLEPI
jgi:hypothetical protein